VREAMGPEVKLLIDCHGRFAVAGVVRLGRALEPYDLLVLEDPVAPDDLAAYAQVWRELPMPIMGSERPNTTTQFRILMDHGGIDVAQPDLMYAGGITEVRKIAAIADTCTWPTPMVASICTPGSSAPAPGRPSSSLPPSSATSPEYSGKAGCSRVSVLARWRC
jgi:L-alanine-DL-glutamate epimerase-like enolase superfamily enzyme